MSITLEQFNAVSTRDRKAEYLPDWFFKWSFHHDTTKEPFFNLDRSGTPTDLQRFMSWIDVLENFDYLTGIEDIVERCIAFERSVVERLGFPMSEEQLQTNARRSASDYVFQNLYPVPEHQQVKRFLDFGAGYGRMLAPWSAHPGIESIFLVDGIYTSYFCQNLYASATSLPFQDYVASPAPIDVTANAANGPMVTHLTSWKLNLIPNDYIDMISCSQVLPEIDPNMVVNALTHFKRILKPGGALYIRDHGLGFTPAHNLPMTQILENFGFVLEYKPHVRDRQDVLGIPRIWRKMDLDALSSVF